MYHFLTRTKRLLATKRERLHFYVGNKSGDLDSVVSALVCAYEAHWRDYGNYPFLHIPVVNTTRAEQGARRDVAHFLEKFGVSLDDLFYVDDLIPISQKVTTLSFVTAIDHNPTKSPLGLVVFVIDHHPKPNLLFWSLEQKNLIRPVGSCATLIFEKFYESGGKPRPEIAGLLHGTIVLDCMNMDPEYKKGTGQDVKALEALEKFWPYLSREREETFRALLEHRRDVSFLTPREILGKDLKCYKMGTEREKMCITSLTMPLSEFFRLCPTPEETLNEFMGEKDGDHLVLLSGAEIFIFTSNPEEVKVERFLGEIFSTDLKLMPQERLPENFPPGFLLLGDGGHISRKSLLKICIENFFIFKEV